MELGILGHKILILSIRKLKLRGLTLAGGHTQTGNLDGTLVSYPPVGCVSYNGVFLLPCSQAALVTEGVQRCSLPLRLQEQG